MQGNEESNDTTFVHLESKLIAIKPTEWDYDFDPDSIFKIDPFNIFGEIITIPVLVNRMGVLVAEMRSYIKKEKIKLEFKEAQVRKLFRQKADKKPTIQEVDDHLISDGVIRTKRLRLIDLEEQSSKIESFWESAKDKSFKLNSFAKSLTPKDFESELIEGVVNGVFIHMRNKQYSEK